MEKLKAAVHKVEMGNRLKAPEDPFAGNDSGIKVCIRVRCFIREELEGARSGGNTKLCIAMPTTTDCTMVREEPKDERNFSFDRCYWSHSKDHPLYADQETLMGELGNSMIKNAMDGFNNCMFAYGQTGSGKSYSVLGGPGEQRGLLPRVVEGLFAHFESDEMAGFDVKVIVTFLEIYNENLHDLLAPKSEVKPALQVKQHPVHGIFVPGLTEAPVAQVEEVLALVDYGNSMRHVSATAMNASSSRSHCVFSFKTATTDKKTSQVKMSQTHLVDLAGSERAGRTQAEGDRLKEGAAINQSLSSLARVISALAVAGSKKKGAKPAAPPPFRDSKLTYILKESLSGNSKTVMMAAISPNEIDFDETLSTMKFAQSVKMIQTKATANTVNVGGIEAQLRLELETLKAQLAKYEELMASGGGDGDEADAGRDEVVREVVVEPSEVLGHRMSVVKQRMVEQEQLMGWYGFNSWDQLLQEERARMKKREAIVRDSEELAQFKENIAKQLEDMPAPASHSSDSLTAVEESLRFRLLPVAAEEEDEVFGRSTLRVPVQSYLAIVGPVAEDCVKREDPNATESMEVRLDNRVTMLKAEAAETEFDVIQELGPEDRSFRLKVMVCIDPDDPGNPQVAIHCLRDGRLDEAVGPDDFSKRAAWIRKNHHHVSKERDADVEGANYFDIWDQAKIAVDLPEYNLMREQLVTAKAEVRRMRHRVTLIDVQPKTVDYNTPDAATRIAQKIARNFESAINFVDESMEKAQARSMARRNM